MRAKEQSLGEDIQVLNARHKNEVAWRQGECLRVYKWKRSDTVIRRVQMLRRSFIGVCPYLLGRTPSLLAHYGQVSCAKVL